MSQETDTDVLLRTILFQSMIAESTEEIIRAIRVMCSKDMIAAVEQEVALYKANEKDEK